MKPTRNRMLLAHERLDAWRVCTELSHEVHVIEKSLRQSGTKERRDTLKLSSLVAVRCIVEGANALKPAEKARAFAAARKAVGVVASELEMFRRQGIVSTGRAAAAFELAGRVTAMLTALIAKFGRMPGG